jgi:hypothetical protein
LYQVQPEIDSDTTDQNISEDLLTDLLERVSVPRRVVEGLDITTRKYETIILFVILKNYFQLKHIFHNVLIVALNKFEEFNVNCKDISS